MTRIVILRLKRWAQPELDRTLGLLRQANAQLDRTLRENTTLRNRNEELNVQVNRLQADNKELHHQIDLLKQARDMQAQTIERMERSYRELREKHDYLYGRVVQLEARLDK